MVKINHKIQVQEWIWEKGYTYLLLERVHTGVATMEIRIYIFFKVRKRVTIEWQKLKTKFIWKIIMGPGFN